MPGALDGLRVLDLTSNLSGPYCCMMLADHGADVLKIEPPSGDAARQMPPFVNGESAPFMIWNRNKRSCVIDLKAERERFLALADTADIVVENYRPGVLDRLGIGWDALHARNPRLILGSISGFGQTGPEAKRGGYDLIAQAMSGLMSINGPEDGPPFRLPIAISDVTAGMFLAFGLLAALSRHATGPGWASAWKRRCWKRPCRSACTRPRIISLPALARLASDSSTAAARHTRCSARKTDGSPSAHRNRGFSLRCAICSGCRSWLPIRASPAMPNG